MFSARDLRNLIIPLILEQLLAVSIGMADTVMVSTAGDAAVAGISLVDSMSVLLINLFTALTTGGSVIATQYLGKGSVDRAKECAKQLEFTVLLISCVIGFACAAFRKPILNLVYGQIEADVFFHADRYFLMLALSYPLLGVYSSGAALFRGMADSKTPLKVSVLMNVINVIGNAICIYIFHLGAMGAGLATLISRVAGSVIITALLMQKKRLIHLEDPLSIKPDGQMIKRILRIGIPSGIENSMFQIGKLLVAGMVSTFGTAAIAANAVANNFTSLQVMPGASVGTAMLTVIGRYMGAGDHEGAKKNAIKLMKLAYLVQWGMIAALLILHKPIMGLYAVTEESVALASKMYVFHAIGSILIWPLSFNMPNVLRAAGDVKYTMTVSMVFVFLARVVSSYLLAFTFNMGVMGIWVGMQIDWVFRSIFFTGRYISGKWLTKKVIE